MRRFSLVAFALVLFALLILGSWVSAPVPASGAGATSVAYLPLVLKQNTPTPTPTATPTATPLPTATPVCSYSHVITGQFTLDQSKQSYAVGENIFFHELITNPTGSRICYGIVGVQVTMLNGSNNFFHTSWSGDLWINPHCTGPTDHCGGAWGDSLQINTPGDYSLTLAICYSTQAVCQTPSGDWQLLTSGVPVTVVVWPPVAPSKPDARVESMGNCYLDIADPQHVHVVCPATK